MATAWTIKLTGDGTSKFIPSLSKNGTLSGGTNYALPAGDSGVAQSFIDALVRGRRRLFNAIADNAITPSDTAFININVSGSGYTPTVNKNGSLSGSTNVALPANEVGVALPFVEATERAFRRAQNAVADGE
jgi:hypothetical protein